MKQIQFEIWKQCNTNCTFCYSGKLKNENDINKKLTNLKNVIDIVKDDSLYKEYDTVGLIGGEFFQGQLDTDELRDCFFNLISILKDKVNSGLLKKIWLNATLAIGEQKDLYKALDILKDTIGEVWVLTSYDTLGRFHTQKMEDTWHFHMNKIHNEYPNVKINITTIITGDLIQKYLSNTFSFKNFIQKYDCSFFIKLSAGIENEFISKQDTNNKLGYFFPKRGDFLKFLIKLKKEDFALYDKLFNIKYRADTLLCEYQNKNIIVKRDKDTKLETYNPDIDHVMSCGHLSIYNCYLDSDNCALCDKFMIENYE